MYSQVSHNSHDVGAIVGTEHEKNVCARSSMDRASDFGSEGWEFEPLRAYLFKWIYLCRKRIYSIEILLRR